MGAFEKFIESDLFFPVLIGLLLLLIIVFVVILILDRKREKKYIQELREELGSDSLTQTIQIPVVKQVVVKKQVEPVQEQVVISNKEEPVQVEEPIEETEESNELDLTKTVAPTILKEMEVKPKVVERTEIAEDAPVVDLKIADTSSDESLEATQVIQINEEENSDDELIVPDAIKQIEEEGEEMEAPEKAIQIEDEGTQIIELPKLAKEEDVIKRVEIKQPNAFEIKTDGNTNINEDIKYEPPKEYTGVKTEVLDITDIVNELNKEK